MAASQPDLVQTPAQLTGLVDELLAQKTFAIDIESNGYYHFVERTCILTISTPTRDTVVDSLALWEHMQLLAPAFSAQGVRVLCHGGSYDVASLKRDFNYRFSHIDDTMIAAQLLGIEAISLAALAARYLNITLSKELQRHNWAERPLQQEHLQYLGGDTSHLFKLTAILQKELEAKDLLEEYAIECRMLAAQPGANKAGVDPESFRRIKEARSMTNAQRGSLRALVMLRDSIAKEMDLAPFRVIGNQTLVDIVYARPDTVAALSRLRGLSRRVLDNHAQALVDAARQGLSEPQPERGPRDEDDSDWTMPAVRPGPETREVAKQIKAWRQTEALSRGIGLQAVLPTPIINEIVRSAPQTLGELGLISRLGEKRLNRYGQILLGLAKPLTQLRRTDKV